MQQVMIRRFRDEDAAETAEMIAGSLFAVNIRDYEEDLLRALLPEMSSEALRERAKHNRFFVAEAEGRILGCGGVGPVSEDDYVLLNIFTAASHQGQGIGRQLVRCLEETAIEEGAFRILISSSITALPFYRRLGYHFTEGGDVLDEKQLYHLEKYPVPEILQLYHTGYDEIREPDVHFGRANADFGQGFYLADGDAFAGKWARELKGREVTVNHYELRTEGLRVKRFRRDGEWLSYISRNRGGYADRLSEYDVIIGPVANDTLYDSYGIFYGDFLSDDQKLRLYAVGPSFSQTALKTERAAKQLRFIESHTIPPEILRAFHEEFRTEQEGYQAELGDAIEKIMGGNL